MTGTAVAIIVVVVVVLVALGIIGRMRLRRRHLQQQFGPEYERAVETAGSRREAEQELAERERRLNEMPLRALPADARDRYAEQWLGVQEMFVDDPVRAVGEADQLILVVMSARGYQTDGYVAGSEQPGDPYQTAADVTADRDLADRDVADIDVVSGADGDRPVADRVATDRGAADRVGTDRVAADRVGEDGTSGVNGAAADGYEQRLADLSVQHAARLDDYRAAHEISDRAAAGTASTEDLRQAMVHYRSLFEELLGDRVRSGRGDTA
jgi:hypothetical protein